MSAASKTDDEVKQAVDKRLSDSARRAYRHTMDTIKNLDEISKRKTPLRDLFSGETIYYRNRLKDYCEKLMFYEPVEYGRRAEDLLWRKVFYEAIQAMKQFKKSAKLPKMFITSYQTHLSAATGFYTHLLFKLQQEFKLNLDNYVDCYFHDGNSELEPTASSLKPFTARTKSWAEKACHRCLLYLGDLARYQKEYEGNRSWVRAQRFYYQALLLMPDNGMPHNQLGTLVGIRYYGLDSAYHYIRCMAASSKFQGASGNLRRVFEKNRKRYQELINRVSAADRELSHIQQRVKDIKHFSLRFLHLMDVFYNLGHNNNESDSADLQSLCQAVVQDFHFCLFHQRPEPGCEDEETFGSEKMTYMEDEMVFKVVVLITIVVHKLQSQGSKQVAAAIALNLAVFSHILNHTLTRLQTAYYEVNNPPRPSGDNYQSGDHQNISTIIIKEDGVEEYMSGSDDSDIDMDKSRKLNRLRRRRYRSGVEDLSEDEGRTHDDQIYDSEDEDDEELNFLTRQSSSSDEDDQEPELMISQDLRPLDQKLDESTNSLLPDHMSRNYDNGSNSLTLHELLTGSINNFVGIEADLQLFSSNLLNDNSLLGQSSMAGSQHDFKKNVRIPPGFDKDPEAQHVAEINRKLATFQIDTDTNSSIPTEESGDDSSTETDSILDRSEGRERQIERVIRIISDEGLLCVIKVLCDWLICQPQIINTCIQSSPLLWSRLSYFLNFLPLESMIAKPENFNSKSLHEHVNLASLRTENYVWKQVYPLREDVNLYKLSPLSESHSNIQFDRSLSLNSTEEAILRVCCLRNFGHRTTLISEGKFTYNTEKKIFCGPNTSSSNQDADTQVQMEDRDARRNQLMKDMAQLRLQSEVSKLKSSLQSGIDRNLPPYLVPDTSAILDKMNLVKQLVGSCKFIIIIPIAVIDHLDLLKKDVGAARDAIRWLEAEFRKGNRYIRAQKIHERISQNQKNLRRKDKDAWRFMQVVECCKYLSEQNPDFNPSGMVSVLTNDNFQSPDKSVKLSQIAQKSQQQGLVIHNVAEFYHKWKEQWKQKG